MIVSNGTVRRSGRQVAYRLFGKGGPRTVWLPGTGQSGKFWEIAQLDTFGKVGSCLFIDYPGTGESDVLPTGSWSCAEFACDIGEVMNALSWKDVNIIGHSLGSAVALEFAKSFAQYALTLSLHAPWKGTGEVERVRRWFEARRATAAARDPDLQQAYVFLLVSPNYLQSNGYSEGALAEMARMGEISNEAQIGHYDADLQFSAVQYLDDIKVPTLVTTGEFDHVIPPAVSEEVSQSITSSSFEILPGVGHLSPLENPQLFNEIQLAFLNAKGG